MCNMNDNKALLPNSTIQQGTEQVTDILVECVQEIAAEMAVLNEFATERHKHLAQRLKALTEALAFVQRLSRHSLDQNRRIGDASITLYDWDGFYDSENQTGDIVRLANLVEDAFTTLQGRSWVEEKFCDDCGNSIPKNTECAVNALPKAVTSANKGESAVLCTPCWSRVCGVKIKKARKVSKAKTPKGGN